MNLIAWLEFKLDYYKRDWQKHTPLGYSRFWKDGQKIEWDQEFGLYNLHNQAYKVLNNVAPLGVIKKTKNCSTNSQES